MGTQRLLGVEIFAAGEWNGCEFTTEDLDGIESAFYALGLAGRIPLKLGHDDTSQLAFGWVQHLFRQGDKLLADVDVPNDVAALINDGRLRNVSVELLANVQAGTRVIPWVLDAVALLGTDQPAVGILKGLHQARAVQTLSRKYPHGERLQCALAEAPLKFDTTQEVEARDDGTKKLAAEVAQLTEALRRQSQKFDALQRGGRKSRAERHFVFA